MFSLFEILPQGLKDVIILDIGAMEEGKPRYYDLAQTGRARVIGVEPNPEQRAKLVANNGKKHSYIPNYLGDGNDATVNITHYPGCISLLEPDPDFIDPFHSIATKESTDNFYVKDRVAIKTTKLDDIENRPKPHLIKIDVQGYELKVLEHGLKTLSSALVVESEVEFLPIYKDQPLFCDIQAFMRDQGFHLHKMLDIAGRCLEPFNFGGNDYAAISQVLWADAVFLRDLTKLSLYSDKDLLYAAIILMDIYRSIDVCFYMLKEYDARSGTKLTDAFVQKLQDLPQQEQGRLYMNLKEYI